MIFITVFSTILALAYFAVAGWWLRGLNSNARSEKSVEPSLIFISVLIPFRNEAACLPGLLDALESQTYPQNCYEVIFIDDHSSDNGPEVIRKWRKHKQINIQLMRCSESEYGKKAALRKGLNAIKGSVILQTDADCDIQQGWIESMTDTFKVGEPQVTLGPVRMLPADNFWSRFAALEFMSLQAAGAAMVGARKPIMGSAANMAYSRTLALQGIHGGERVSGDDVFLIQQAGRTGTVKYIFSEQSLVETSAPESFNDFIKQRARWGGKTPAYSSSIAKAIAALVAIFAVWQVSLLIIAFANLYGLYLFVGIWIVKMAADYPLLRKFARKTGQVGLLQVFFHASVIYPFYILITLVVILFAPVTWKERSIRPLTD